MSTEAFYWVGVIFSLCCAGVVLAGFIALVAFLNVAASRYFVEMVGGWKVFREFQAWNQRRKQEGEL